MGVRETLNENKAVKITVVSVIVIVIGFFLFRSTVGERTGTPKAFFTDDDGATWFADEITKLPPFDHNGKRAVMCFVYKTGPNGKPWVSHLQRYTAEGIKQRTQQMNDKNFNPMGFEAMQRTTVEVKEAKTGDKGWVSISDPAAAKIQELKSPDGGTGEILPVDPNE